MVEKTDTGSNADLLFDPEGVPWIGIEVYRYVDFSFVGYSLELCRSWAIHWPGSSGGEVAGRGKVSRLFPSVAGIMTRSGLLLRPNLQSTGLCGGGER